MCCDLAPPPPPVQFLEHTRQPLHPSILPSFCRPGSNPFLSQDNPEYSFLFDGAGSAFYRWALYCKLHGLQVDQPPPQPQQPHAPAVQEEEALPADVDSGFSQVLAALTGSKVPSSHAAPLSHPGCSLPCYPGHVSRSSCESICIAQSNHYIQITSGPELSAFSEVHRS